MGCKLHLIPLNAGGSPNGRWFLTNYSGSSFDGDLSISCDNTTFVTVSGLPDDTVPLDNSCPDTTDIWVDISGEAPGVYTFTFVSPDTANAEDCMETCIDCQTFTVTAEEVPGDAEFSHCDSDPDTYNVFTALSIDPLDYTIEGVTGCTLGAPDCVQNNGDYVPEDMGAGIYVVSIRRNDSDEDCEDCLIEYTINIEVGGDAGDPQSGVVCLGAP